MFDFVHEKKRLVQFVLALIILPFAFWGVDSYQKSGDAGELASVNGEKISVQEFDNALRQQKQRMSELAGAGFDQSVFEKPEVKHSILDGLVSQRLLVAEARNSGLIVNDEQLAGVIGGIAAFQKEGKFDKQQYESALNAQNMSPLMFESRVRDELTSRQLTDAYSRNGYASSTVADHLIRLNEQQRLIASAQFNLEAFMSQVKVTDSAIAAYYKDNQAEFQLPERAKVEYVVFSVESLLSQVAVDESEVKKYYSENQAEFGTQEQRQAAHILISLPAQASEAEKQALKAKAEEVLGKVKQAPASFAGLAKQYSQDPGSASNGGDLGMFGRGMMVKSFEDAVFQLKVGETSGLVQSDFGFHIIRLSAIKPAKLQALADVREAIVQRLKVQKATDRFAELAEKFSNAVYEQSDSLKPAAELVGVPVRQGDWLNKGQAATGIWTDKVLQAVFSDDVLKNKRNTAAVEVSSNMLLAARVAEYQAATVRPLSEVAGGIQKKLQQQQASELAIKQGNEMLARLQRGEKVNVLWQSAKPVTRSQHAGFDAELIKQVFQAGASKLPAYVGVRTAQNGFALARIDSVKEIETIDEGKRNRYLQQIAQISGEELLRAYLADAKKRADISVKPFAPEEKK